EFIARMLCPGARRSRAGITKDEKAKKTPAERPQPRAVARVRYWTRRLMPRSEERLAETVHGQIARLHARASTSGLRGDLHVLRPLGIDRVELGAHVDVVPGPRGRSGDGRDFIGVWTAERKIASIGVHRSREVTTHGFAVNVDNDLQPFEWVVPCGLPDVRMTSIARELGTGDHLPCFRKR